MDLISPLTGLRKDGRFPDEIRDIKCVFGVAKDADGSVMYEQGNTKILATVFGPAEAEEDEDDDGDLALIVEPTAVECEFKLSSISVQDRRFCSTDDPRSEEYAEYLETCYKVVMFPHKTSQSIIKVVCQVLQADGSYLAASITAGTLALIDAGIPIKDLVIGCSSTVIDTRTLTDLSAQEELQRLPLVTVGVVAKTGEIIVLDTKNRFHKDLLRPMMDAAVMGCRKIFSEVERLVRDHVKETFTQSSR